MGSTAFKNSRGSERSKLIDPHPIWVEETRRFYRDFPKLLSDKFEQACGFAGLDGRFATAPLLWKTIGDEIVLCNRVHDAEHLCTNLNAFLASLSAYSDVLEGRRKLDGKSPTWLNIKGSAWVAGFPAPNVSVNVSQRVKAESLETTELFENEAETNPHEYDFLGRGIDAGFRIAKFAETDRLAISAELALLLCDSATRGALNARMHYLGREHLKGVFNNRPYPVIVLDTEKSLSRKEVRQHERTLLGLGDTRPEQLKVFLNSFFEDEDLEQPTFESSGEKPESYKLFAEAWDASSKENTGRDKVEEESGTMQTPAERPAQSEKSAKALRERLRLKTSRVIKADKLSD